MVTGAEEPDLAGDQLIHRDPCPRIQGPIQLGALTCISNPKVTIASHGCSARKGNSRPGLVLDGGLLKLRAGELMERRIDLNVDMIWMGDKGTARRNLNHHFSETPFGTGAVPGWLSWDLTYMDFYTNIGLGPRVSA
ncbi:hypothetical protein B0H65DRAFT_442508 [Neurospora tetraspora]|uniref:Uncharacterized protein n=1 Tax=Neurospora tetraspora TaxID=94610 RepID=A0AAE0MSX6_9PEZI|nr:hypothetical protein B0H65DRAFT_442508 [Neurospora tetraspora]